jgi:hypothetical protein
MEQGHPKGLEDRGMVEAAARVEPAVKERDESLAVGKDCVDNLERG